MVVTCWPNPLLASLMVMTVKVTTIAATAPWTNSNTLCNNDHRNNKKRGRWSTDHGHSSSKNNDPKTMAKLLIMIDEGDNWRWPAARARQEKINKWWCRWWSPPQGDEEEMVVTTTLANATKIDRIDDNGRRWRWNDDWELRRKIAVTNMRDSNKDEKVSWRCWRQGLQGMMHCL